MIPWIHQKSLKSPILYCPLLKYTWTGVYVIIHPNGLGGNVFLKQGGYHCTIMAAWNWILLHVVTQQTCPWYFVTLMVIHPKAVFSCARQAKHDRRLATFPITCRATKIKCAFSYMRHNWQFSYKNGVYRIFARWAYHYICGSII